jgi:hypothetical protein
MCGPGNIVIRHKDYLKFGEITDKVETFPGDVRNLEDRA